MFMMVDFDETLTGGEMLMSLREWVVPWRVPFTQSSDKSRSRVLDMVLVRKAL